jgi:nucleoside-diphosphate-sugar epimerase
MLVERLGRATTPGQNSTMKALVTGAAGFIGSNLVRRLLSDGHRVTGVDNLFSGHRRLVEPLFCKDFELWECDMADARVLDAVRARSFDVVFHLAARPRVPYSVEFPLETHLVNVDKSLALLDACRGNVSRFVFSSSSSVTGNVTAFPTPEEVECRPLSPYALQKRTVEEYCRVFSELYGLETVSLRYYTVFGPNQFAGNAYATVIAAWCQAIREGGELRVDGDGTDLRDFCYVDDAIEANILAATSSRRFAGDLYNVAGGEQHTINDLKRLFSERFGSRARWRSAPARRANLTRTHADLRRARSELGYEPRISFAEGLARTFAWWGI